MLLAHRRPWLIPLIVRQFTTEFKAIVDITVDRPSADVVEAVASVEGNPRVRVFEAPHAVLDGRERFMEVRNFQLDRIRDAGCRYGAIVDDDHILEHPSEARFMMGRDYDLVYCKKRFLWDSLESYNTAVPEHNSVLFFKIREGDYYPLDRTINAPAGVHDDPTSRSRQMQSVLLDIGYLWATERERVFRDYAQSGKIDSATMSLVSPPVLKKLERKPCEKGYWQKELERELACLLPDKTP